MNSKQQKTLQAVFATPANGNIEWRKIEALLVALGCEINEGNGSAVSFKLNGQHLDVHRPHPNKESLKYRVKATRLFLTNAGIQP